MKQSAKLAREYGVHLHTHLAETEDEEQFCLKKFGHRPVGYMQEVDWMGEDVWFAHAVWVNEEEIKIFRQISLRCGALSNFEYAARFGDRTGQRISYMLVLMLASAWMVPHPMMVHTCWLKSGKPCCSPGSRKVYTGYSLSNDPNRKLMTAREALYLATRGGAAVLGRNDIGSLEIGKCADFFAINLNRLEYAGALLDPVSATVFCQPVSVDYTVVGGRFVVKDGALAYRWINRS